MEFPFEIESAVANGMHACFVLSLFARGSLPYAQGGTDETRQGIVESFEDYAALWGEHLRWFGEANTERYRRFDDATAGYPRGKLVRNDKGRAPSAMWAAYGGQDRHGASAWRFEGRMCGATEVGFGQLDYAAASWDIRAIDAQYTEMVEVALKWARRFPVLHGYCGFSLNLRVDRQQILAARAYALATRFQGLELHDPTPTSLWAGQKVKGVNWLTIVAEKLLAPIGGVSALRAALSKEILIHPVRDGVLIQAGPVPLLGDVNRGETLPLYREVARFLKPIREGDNWLFWGILRAPDWWSRFDG